MSVNIKNLEKLAYHNAPMPKDLELPEQLLFLSLRFMYGGFKHNQIDKGTAEKEKNKYSVLMKFLNLGRILSSKR